jgi:hypothetical protein
MTAVLDRVAARAAADSPLWRAAVREPGDGAEMVAGCPPQLELGVEMIREGYLLHRGRARVFALDDADLALLTGDYLYAAGLAEICRSGDLGAVAVLARLIAGCARAQGDGSADGGESLWPPAIAELSGRHG